MKVQTGCSKYDKKVIVDRVKGLIFGSIVGASLGLATENMSRAEVEQEYSDQPIIFGINDQNQGTMVNREALAGVVDDNNFNGNIVEKLLLLRAIVENHGIFSYKNYALRLSHYCDPQQGNSPLTGNTDKVASLSDTTKAVVNHTAFKTDPYRAAREVWETNTLLRSTSGALVRAALLGVPKFWDSTTVTTNTVNCCRVTHPDQQSMISCVIVSSVVARMLRGYDVDDSRQSEAVPLPLPSPPLMATTGKRSSFTDALDTDDKLNTLIRGVIDNAGVMLTNPNSDPLFGSLDLNTDQAPVYNEFLKQCYDGSNTLHNLQLDSDDQHHVFKCLRAALYAFTRRIPPDQETMYFKKILMDLVKQGGKASSNASVAGALLGIRIGYNQLPTEWLVGLKRWEWLEDEVNEFCSLL